MCETVGQYFESIHVARNIRDGYEYRNTSTGEKVTRDVVPQGKIPETALRIVTEGNWRRGER